MKVHTLEATTLRQIHPVFLEAFSDYIVPMKPTEDQWEEMLARRGYRADLSVGVFDGTRMVAFTLNGLSFWNAKLTGYDCGTAVVPSHRRRGLSKSMIEESIELLAKAGATRYLLEVIQTNEKALSLYRAAQFEVTRELPCFKWSHVSSRSHAKDNPVIDEIDALEVIRPDFFDWSPSWQNSTESLQRARWKKIILQASCDGEPAGYAVVFPDNGDLAQFAVARSARRRRVGRAIVEAAAERSAGSLRIVNVDGSSEATLRFLSAIGATEFIRQFEMIRTIGRS